MSNVVQINPIESALMRGDLSKLSDNERLSYYHSVCESLGLNSLTQPFAYITLNGKLTLYAKRDATDQLRKIHDVSINITSREKIDDIYIVTARAKNRNGREDEATGAVSVAGLKGEALANAFLKCETKAKRRVTLSLCGLGLLDETEVDSIPQEAKVVPPQAQEQIEAPKNHAPRSAAEILDGPEPSLGETLITVGQKFRGKKFKDCKLDDLRGYADWLCGKAKDSGRPLSDDAAEFVKLVDAYSMEVGV